VLGSVQSRFLMLGSPRDTFHGGLLSLPEPGRRQGWSDSFLNFVVKNILDGRAVLGPGVEGRRLPFRLGNTSQMCPYIEEGTYHHVPEVKLSSEIPWRVGWALQTGVDWIEAAVECMASASLISAQAQGRSIPTLNIQVEWRSLCFLSSLDERIPRGHL
jgi:hypothetical protein